MKILRYERLRKISKYERHMFDEWVKPHKTECAACGWQYNTGDWIPVDKPDNVEDLGIWRCPRCYHELEEI